MLADEWRDRIQVQRDNLRKYRLHWTNESPAGWLSKESRKALDNQLSRVSVNWPRVVVQSVSERLHLKGFRVRGENDLDNELTRLLDTANIRALQELTHNDWLLYGAAYGTAWTDRNGRPIYIADSPLTASAIVDPATMQVMEADEWRDRIQVQRDNLREYRLHWTNQSPAGWLSKESRKALDNQLSRVSVNWPRVVVQSVSERLHLKGFRVRGENDLDNELTRLLDTANIRALQELTHNDWLLYGAAYGTAWTDRNGRPIYIADSPLTASAIVDPATMQVMEAARSWIDHEGRANLVIMTDESMSRYRAKTASDFAVAAQWVHVETWENDLEAVPMVPFIRRESSDDMQGSSLVSDILDLTDANSKALGDAMVTSEYFAKPRRWATGLEIQEDEDGNPIDPFGASRLLQSEDPDTKFGQLNPATPAGQTELIATITQQIGAITGLPPHYLGLHGDQPASAEGVRAAETQLVSKAYAEQAGLSLSWVQVIGRLQAIQNKLAYSPLQAAAMWEPAETKTPAQAADAAQKLRAIGVPLESLLSNPLDYEPHEIREIVQQADREATREALNNMGRSI